MKMYGLSVTSNELSEQCSHSLGPFAPFLADQKMVLSELQLLITARGELS